MPSGQTVGTFASNGTPRITGGDNTHSAEQDAVIAEQDAIIMDRDVPDDPAAPAAEPRPMRRPTFGRSQPNGDTPCPAVRRQQWPWSLSL